MVLLVDCLTLFAASVAARTVDAKASTDLLPLLTTVFTVVTTLFVVANNCWIFDSAADVGNDGALGVEPEVMRNRAVREPCLGLGIDDGERNAEPGLHPVHEVLSVLRLANRGGGDGREPVHAAPLADLLQATPTGDRPATGFVRGYRSGASADGAAATRASTV